MTSPGSPSLEVIPTAIPDVRVVRTKKFADHRGFFSETYNRKAFADAGITVDFVQDNHSRSVRRGTLRGLHFQIPPFTQDKLVRVVRGAALDVAVDLRRTAPTFGQHVAVRLSAEDWNQVFIPCGFAHGLLTLEDDTEVVYKVSNYYAPEHDRGLRWNDPDLDIDWGLPADAITLSDKDRTQPAFRNLPPYFE